jgi:hypothetical protein
MLQLCISIDGEPAKFALHNPPISGHSPGYRLESTVRYLGVDIEDAIVFAEGTEV